VKVRGTPISKTVEAVDVPAAEQVRTSGLGWRRRSQWLLLVAVMVGVGVGAGGQFLLASRPPAVRSARDHPTPTRALPKVDPPSQLANTGQPPGMHLVFDAGFAGSKLDTSVWQLCYPWEDFATGCTNFGNVQEVEWYLRSQVVVSGDALHLDAVHVPTSGTATGGAPKTYPYRSGMVTTYRSFNFTYGYVRIVARLPAGPDLWPALWLLPVSQNPRPEIDMVEGSPNPTRSLIALHPVGAAVWAQAIQTANLSVGWHTFTLNWEPGTLTWSVDGKKLFTTSTEVPDVQMYLLATLAVTDFAPQCLGSSVPSSCSGSMAIRSVQVWQR